MPRPRASRQKVEAVIKQVRGYYQLGQELLKAHVERGGYDAHFFDAEAAERGCNSTYLRKAAQFARAPDGYSPHQLEQLVKLLRTHRALVGITHIGLLVTLRWKRGRMEVQSSCIRERWSKAVLQAEIHKRVGRARPHCGRRRRIDDASHALVQLEGIAESWRRWSGLARGDPTEQMRGVLADLPKSIRKQVAAVDRCMAALQEAVLQRRRR